ncbi:MAG: hypothetical protein D6733_03840 [Methanobacteriota archaeon]|nr:MAG: hypothetical protein D6733_03840 [Euryarchaeota archaeon]
MQGEIGLQEKTVIVGINGKPVRNVSEFQRILDTLENDQEVSITWSREGRWYGGQNIKVKKPLGVKIGTYTPLEGSWECDQISLFEKELKQSQA